MPPVWPGCHGPSFRPGCFARRLAGHSHPVVSCPPTSLSPRARRTPRRTWHPEPTVSRTSHKTPLPSPLTFEVSTQGRHAHRGVERLGNRDSIRPLAPGAGDEGAWLVGSIHEALEHVGHPSADLCHGCQWTVGVYDMRPPSRSPRALARRLRCEATSHPTRNPTHHRRCTRDTRRRARHRLRRLLPEA